MPYSHRNKPARENAKNRRYFFKARRTALQKREEDARLQRIASSLQKDHDKVVKYFKPPEQRGPGYTPGYVPLEDYRNMDNDQEPVQHVEEDPESAATATVSAGANIEQPVPSSSRASLDSQIRKAVVVQAMAVSGRQKAQTTLAQANVNVKREPVSPRPCGPAVTEAVPDSVEVPCDNAATGNVNSNDGVNNGAVNDGPGQLERTQSDASSTGSLQPDPQENNNTAEDGSDSDDWMEDDAYEGQRDFDMSLEFFRDPELNDLAMAFLNVYATGGVKKTTAAKFWELHRTFGKFDRKQMKGFPSLLTKVRKLLPKITMSWKVKDIVTGRVHTGQGPVFPERKFRDKNRYIIQEMWSRLDLRDLAKFHIQLHPGKANQLVREGVMQPDLMPLYFTSDGIPCGKSTPDNLHVTAVRFRGCKNVYILETRIARRKQAKILDEFLCPIIDACLDSHFPVLKYLGDAPMRAFYKCMKGHAGYFSCEVCEAEGVCVNRRVCYPSSTLGACLRTTEKWREAVNELEESEVDNIMGVTGRSPLLRLPGFDMVADSPSDPLHRDFLGMTKNMWRLCTNPNKQGNLSARTQTMLATVSKAYTSVRLPQEFSHRSRPVDMANFKSHEWKSLLMTSFPVIADAAQELRGGQSGVMWTLFAFLLRIYNGPEHFMNEIGEESLRSIHKRFYIAFESEFGEAACSFNVHAFSHMIENRKFGRQHVISTEAFESAYGMIQLSYAPGTRCIGKQILERMLIRLLRFRGHNCDYTLTFSRFKQENRNDDSIVTDDKWNFFKVKDVQKDTLTVVKIHKTRWVSEYDGDLPFHKAGVFRFNGYSDEKMCLPKSYFTGKGAMLEKKILMGLYWDLLFS